MAVIFKANLNHPSDGKTVYVQPISKTFSQISLCCLLIWNRRIISLCGLWDELITRPEESYRLWCVVVCDLENLKNEEAMTRVGSQRHSKKRNIILYYIILYYIILYYIILYYIILYYIILYYIIYFITLHYIILYYMFYYITLHYII